jgi:hypothetical protein
MVRRIPLYKMLLIVFILSIAFTNGASAQEKTKAACIAFYNVENLFDTIDDPLKNDAEFLPNGMNQWTSARYYRKLENMAYVINQIGGEILKGGPTILGLSEIENRTVIEDLINTPPLKGMGYDIVHFDSPDKRGIDVGLIYKKAAFQVTNSTSNRLTMPGRTNWYSRDQLVVSGKLDGEMIHIIVNHWPSRAAGSEYREAAAALSLRLSDSIRMIDPDAKIFILGDLNDDPTDPSVYKVLGARGKVKEVKKDGLYNPMFKLHQQGIGTLAYRDAWNLFDQIIVSYPLISKEGTGWKYYKTGVFNQKFMLQKEGPYAGYPFRTFAGGAYAGGYSDHFPVYMFIVKKHK